MHASSFSVVTHWTKPLTNPKPQVSVWFHCFTRVVEGTQPSTKANPRHLSLARNWIRTLLTATIALNLSERTTVLLNRGSFVWEGGIPPDLHGKNAGLPGEPSFHRKSCTASYHEMLSICSTTLPFSLKFRLGPRTLLSLLATRTRKRQRHCWQENGKGNKGEALQAM